MLLDVNETMGAHLADAKLALKSQVTSKILFNKQDVLGIGLVGTEGTDNMVADEMGDGQYEHVSVVKKVAKATFSSLEALDAAACSGASGDYRNAAAGWPLLSTRLPTSSISAE